MTSYKKEKGKKRDRSRDRSRGRSRKRHSDKESRDRRRERDRDRRRSRQDVVPDPRPEALSPSKTGKPVLTPAGTPGPRADPIVLPDEDEYEEEDSESESQDNDVEIRVAAAPAAPAAPAGPGPSKLSMEPASKEPLPSQEGEKAGSGAGEAGRAVGDAAKPTSRRDGSRPPPEPENPPKHAKIETEKDSWKSKDNDKKYGRYTCQVCGRRVGGGEAGSYQHRRSAYHLASWIYWQRKEKKAWHECTAEGSAWAKMLWDNDKEGPADADATKDTKKKKKARAAAPVRADPERKRRDRDPDYGPDGPGGSSGAAGSKDGSLLLKMWQTTLRELKS